MADISASEMALLRTQWDAYYENLDENGCDLFIRLFKENPDYIAWFPTFSTDLKGDNEVIRAAQADFSWISELIDNELEGNTAAKRKLLRKLRACHVRAKVTEPMFDQFKQCLVNEMTDKLGQTVMTDHMTRVWHMFFDNISLAIYPL